MPRADNAGPTPTTAVTHIAIQEAIDGSVTLRLEVPVSGELQRWVLQFGSEAEVLSPPALRRAVAAELQRAAAPYRARS